jgi:hypothetical protein
MVMVLKAFSFGGGVQSTAALVLAAQGRIDYRTFLFCNVGQDSENPDTLAYVQQVALPFAHRQGLNLIELRKVRRDGSPDSVYQTITRAGSRSIGIPVHLANGAPGRRACTLDFKIRVVDRWLKREWQAHRVGVLVGLGISLDEFTRMRTNTDPHTLAWKTLDYPLIDLRLDRMACMRLIEQAGLPVPPRSSCWFCPYHSQRAWQQLRDKQPILFAQAVALEQLINERQARLGKGQVYLSRKCKPLPLATTEYVQSSFLEDEQFCESGYCFV